MLSRLASALTDKQHLASSLIRVMAGVSALYCNVLIAKYLSLDQIGYYYLYATLAYFGNAALYVGLGILLQRQCASLAISLTLSKHFFIRYIGVSLLIGLIVVTAFAATYLSATSAILWTAAIPCAVLSAATYLSTLGKDLLALSRKPALSATFSLIEQGLRLIFVVLTTVTLMRRDAIVLVLAMALGSLLSSIAALGVILLSTEKADCQLPRLVPREILRTITPIGFSGLLNWLQLQCYRPALLFFGAKAELVGIISLLTVLGTAGANPVLTVANQSYVPRIYAHEPAAFNQYVRGILTLTVCLAVAAIPAAFAFLALSSRQALAMYLILVPLGVIVEAGNSLVGAFMHRQNAARKSMWMLPASTAVGVAVAVASWFVPVTQSAVPFAVALGMVVSQLAVVAMLGILGRK